MGGEDEMGRGRRRYVSEEEESSEENPEEVTDEDEEGDEEGLHADVTDIDDDEELEEEEDDDRGNGGVAGIFQSLLYKRNSGDASLTDPVEDINGQIESNAELYVTWLRKLVNLKSVASDPDLRPQCTETAKQISGMIKSMGGVTRLKDVRSDASSDIKPSKLPPVVYGEFGSAKDRSLMTLLVYTNYDVPQGYLYEEETGKWADDPFELIVEEKILRGRGTATKGYLIAWLAAIHAYREARDGTLPVRIKFICEGMRDMNSEGLPQLIQKESASGDFDDVDAVAVSCFQWVDSSRPTLIDSIRGAAFFELKIKSGSKTLEAGFFRGTVDEPLTDMTKLLSTLTTIDGEVVIEGVTRNTSDKELVKRFSKVDVDPRHRMKEIGNSDGKWQAKKPGDFLIQKCLSTQLSIHSLETSEPFSSPSSVVANEAVASFSIRFPPGLNAEDVEKNVTRHLRKQMSNINSSSELIIRSSTHGPFALEEDGFAFRAAETAVKRTFDVVPEILPDGNSSKIVEHLEKHVSKDFVLMPLGLPTDSQFTSKEHINRAHFLDTITYLVCFLEELSASCAEEECIPKRFSDEYLARRRPISRLVNIWKR